MSTKLKFANRDKSTFLATLKARTDLYFRENNLSRQGNSFMTLKTVFFLSVTVTLYVLMLSLDMHWSFQLLMVALLGAGMAFIGFNVCHDAIHGSYSSKKSVNKSLGFIFNIIGANAYLWNLSHNIVHHSYTNIVDHDEDIEIAPGLIRMHEHDRVKPLHRFQHIYAFFLYGLTTISWFFRKDFVKFFKKNIGSSHVNKHPRVEYFNLFFYKSLYYFLFIVLPLLIMDLTAGEFMAGFVVMHVAQSLVLGSVFQLAHVVENTEIRYAENNLMDDSWAVHQLKTTANFSARCPIATFLCGGLNMQIEHHLFPKICHVHYPKLAPIVKKTAAEFNLPYHENKTYWTALRSHYYLLKKMGRAA